MATYRCGRCTGILDFQGAPCRACGGSEADSLSTEILNRADLITVSTFQAPTNIGKFEEIGLVLGTSSKQAFWGLSTQADRLTRAYGAALSNLKYEAASIGADAVYGVNFALNNSAGSGNGLLAGSSEAVMLLGTAIRIIK